MRCQSWITSTLLDGQLWKNHVVLPIMWAGLGFAGLDWAGLALAEVGRAGLGSLTDLVQSDKKSLETPMCDLV